MCGAVIIDDHIHCFPVRAMNDGPGIVSEQQQNEKVHNPVTGRREPKYSIEVNEGTGMVLSHPQIFSIEVTTRCNLRCKMCGFHSIYRKDREPGTDVPEELFSKAMPFARRAELVPLCGGGEPLLHPKLAEMVRAVSDLGVPTVITTNGILMDGRTGKELMEAGLTYVEFSVDGTSSYEGLRGAPFEKLRKNIMNLSLLKRERGSPTPVIDLSFTAMRDTLPELVEIVELGAEAGVREIRVQPLQVFFESFVSQNVYLDEARTVEMLGAARERGEQLGVKLCVRRTSFAEDERYGDDERANSLRYRYGCLEPFNSMTVRTDGSIQVCCGGIVLSDTLRERSLDELWNSNEMKKLRRELISGQYRRKCRECNLVFGSAERQVKIERKATLRDLAYLRRFAFRQYLDHLRRRGIVRGNIDAIRKLGQELGGEAG